jgi:tricorn protease-like protein
MKNIIVVLLFLCESICAQLPDTDIYLSNISKTDSGYNFSQPENITDHEGYDNQPYFTPDGSRMLYVSIEDSTQSDIYAYDLRAKVRIQLTNTPESEYSPAYSTDRKFLSTVRVDADSGQRFYFIPLNDLKKSAAIHNSDSIGYGCILNDSMLAMFILGRSNTLQVLNMKNGQRKLIASDIGRCMKLSPDRSEMFFVLKGNQSEWFIYSMNCKDYSLKRIIQTLPTCEDFAVMPDGKILMGKEGKLYFTEQKSEWKMMADFTFSLSDFYRISINADGTLIALVVFKGKKP